jgi:hypothetical protein
MSEYVTVISITSYRFGRFYGVEGCPVGRSAL